MRGSHHQWMVDFLLVNDLLGPMEQVNLKYLIDMTALILRNLSVFFFGIDDLIEELSMPLV